MRLYRVLPLILPLLPACTDRPLGDTDGGSSTTAGSTAGSTTATTGTTTTATATSPLPTTSDASATSGPVTTGPVSTVTSDASDVSSDTDQPVKLDFERPQPPPNGLVGCTLAAPPGTMIEGASGLGPFVGDRAYFGVARDGGTILVPVLMFLSPGAGVEIELDNQDGQTGPIVFGSAETNFFEFGWIGKWPLFATMLSAGKADNVNSDLVITALDGNWDAPDPDDPPRITGTVTGALSGSFEAIYCDKLDDFVIAE